jgi:hypothetical protein
MELAIFHLQSVFNILLFGSVGEKSPTGTSGERINRPNSLDREVGVSPSPPLSKPDTAGLAFNLSSSKDKAKGKKPKVTNGK